MIDLMPSSMALLAPNVNSYRRFQPGMYVPTQASWGHNNRTVALRIPCGDRHNHRVEYRVAGADANPYLVMAAIFAGILHGLDNELPLQEEVEGNGLEQEGLPFPIRQSDALGEFIENDHLRPLFRRTLLPCLSRPVKMMSCCSLSASSQKQKLSGC
ncbi:gamma-Glu-putrescine synthase PuuA [Escherichia coli]|uniref:Gamma-Glu-putrescine synthase PuuA n=1 Tax=Escherichia coli TaxID=562 RepID=A0A376MWF3_ECOLX|nr:gamma-Glu-putrescine synthase PuuA [Escherichia coli]